jgi:hypothetical protein
MTPSDHFDEPRLPVRSASHDNKGVKGQASAASAKAGAGPESGTFITIHGCSTVYPRMAGPPRLMGMSHGEGWVAPHHRLASATAAPRGISPFPPLPAAWVLLAPPRQVNSATAVH